MFKRLLSAALAVVCLIILSSCDISRRDGEDWSYSDTDYIPVSMEEASIRITYPKFIDETVNDTIRRRIDEYLAGLYGETAKSADFACEMTYSVKCNSEDTLSIAFTSNESVKSGAEPNNGFFCVNIDKKTQKPVSLQTAVGNIDDFANRYFSALSEQKPEVYQLLSDKDASLFTVSEKYKSNRVEFYIGDKQIIGVSIKTAHALGDFAVVEVKVYHKRAEPMRS